MAPALAAGANGAGAGSGWEWQLQCQQIGKTDFAQGGAPLLKQRPA